MVARVVSFFIIETGSQGWWMRRRSGRDNVCVGYVAQMTIFKVQRV
jgi:hypothetical protein